MYGETERIYGALHDGTCRLSGNGSAAAGPRAPGNYGFVAPGPALPAWAARLRLSPLPARACLVSLELFEECGEGRCWKGHGVLPVTFDFPGRFWSPRFHELRCAALAAQYHGFRQGFSCSLARGGERRWGVFAAHKEDLPSMLLLDAVLAMQTGLPFLIWALCLSLTAARAALGLLRRCRGGRPAPARVPSGGETA